MNLGVRECGRRDSRRGMARNLLITLGGVANGKADEARNLNVLSQLGGVALDKLINGHARVADVGLLKEELGLDGLFDAARHDLLHNLLGLALKVLAGSLNLQAPGRRIP
eukprot:scaffold111622_cov33-Tisochrysis_lutea.AAC.3